MTGVAVVLFAFLVLYPVSRVFGAEEHSFQGGPQVGEEAPLFTLRDSQGREVRLEDFRKTKPVVLVTGSYTCPVYRQRHAALQQLYDRYHNRAAFFVLYTIEAHPVEGASPYAEGEWVTDANRGEGILFRQPATYEERVGLAVKSQQHLASRLPVVVDGMDNAVWEQYGSAPNAAFLIDSAGKVALRQDWFDPVRFERELLEVLQEEPARW